MKKKPYLIVGSGKLARHFTHYFDLLEIEYFSWSRNSKDSFEELANQSEKIIVLIKDDEIEDFIRFSVKKYQIAKTWIHCSGLLSIAQAESVHPLFTFGDELCDLETYQKIPFITENGKTEFHDLFPKLKNKSFSIPSEQKALYHAWCSMSGNFSTILWLGFFEAMKKMNLPIEAVFPYLEQITDNLKTQPNPLTGPLSRGDKKTINKHISVLENDSFLNIYKVFAESFENLNIKGENK